MRGTSSDTTPDQTRAARPAFVRARRRAFGALACTMAGMWIIPALGLPSAWWFTAAVVAALAGVPAPARWWWGPAGAAVLAAAAGWAQLRLNEPSPARADALLGDNTLSRIEGTVRTTPKPVSRPDGPGAPGAWRDAAVWFELSVRTVGEGRVAADGSITVIVPESGFAGVRPGDRITVRGVFRRPNAPTNPGEPDWSRYANQRGHAGSLTVPGDGLIERRADGVSPAWRVVRWRDALRARAADALGDDPVLRALVLGQRDRDFEASYRVFQRAGVAHVLAVSGFHLALLAGMVVVLVRATGERGRLESLCAFAAIGVMLFLVPANAPIVRAGVLALAVLLADAAGRRWDRLTVLAWAATGLLIWRPLDASGLGFLLSVGITALLLAMGERDRAERWALIERQRPGGWRSAARRVAKAFRVNACCWLVGTPVIAAATGVVSLAAPVAAVVIVPLAGLLLALGWMQAILGLVLPGIAARTAGLPVALAGVCTGLASWFDRLPFASVVVHAGWGWAGVATACAAAWVLRPDRRRWTAPALIACTIWLIAGARMAGRVDGLRIDMLDVGDGTAALVRSGREALWWDCGALHRDVDDIAADAARALGSPRVRTAIITHANLDHFNALPGIAESCGLREVLITPALDALAEGPWAQTRALLESRGVTFRVLRAGDAFVFGDARAEVLWAGAADDPRWLGNDGSMVVRFTLPTGSGERSLVLCGDIQTAGIARLLAAYPGLTADIAEAPHHGSANAAAVEFVGSLSPRVVLQSSGPSRTGLPAWDAVRASTMWLATPDLGAVHAHIRPDGVIITGPSRTPSGRVAADAVERRIERVELPLLGQLGAE